MFRGTKLTDASKHPLEHIGSHTGVDSYPETVIHNKIGILQFAYHTIPFPTLAHLIKSRMFNQVTGKEIARLDLAAL
jgi:hypothetical protein